MTTIIVERTRIRHRYTFKYTNKETKQQIVSSELEKMDSFEFEFCTMPQSQRYRARKRWEHKLPSIKEK